MIEKIPSLARLVKQLQQVPYLASKNLYRVMTYFLTIESEKAEQFCATLLAAKMNIESCALCFAWKEKGQTCIFCGDVKRDGTIVCIVETWQELITIEKTEGYKGLYHVLGGAICPLDGIGPEDLSIELLVARLANNPAIQEIILATNQTPEGEATAAYIAKKLKQFSVKISCLARGIPVGSTLEYLDRLTVFKAISERRPF